MSLSPTFFGRQLTARVPLAVPQLPWRVTSMSQRAMGGCFRAELVAEGDPVLLTMFQTLLRSGVELRDEGELVWWGYVHECTIRWAGSESGASLEEMGNRVKAQYRKLLPGETSPTAMETAWEEDDYSISEYGTKEKILTITSLTTDEAAENARDRALTAGAMPVTVGDFSTPDQSKKGVLVMVCFGWWRTLRWRLFGRGAGRISYLATGKIYQAIGQDEYTSNTINFEDTPDGDAIFDDVPNFHYVEGLTITTSGATELDNNGTFEIAHVIPGHTKFYITGADLDDEAAGAFVTITPLGDRCAQSFTAPAEGFSLGTIACRVGKVGNPLDNFRLSVYSNSAGSPGSSLANATIAGTELGTTAIWKGLELASPYALTGSATYWVHADRTGAHDPENYYIVELDSGAGYGGGTFKYYNPFGLVVGWSTRSASMPFDLIAVKETTTVIQEVLAALGDFFPSVTVETESGVFTTITQLDDVQALTVVEDLLGVGTTNRRRLFATVNPDRSVVIYQEPAADARGYVRRIDGTVRDEYGADVPLARVKPGKWMAAEAVLQHAPPRSEMYSAARAMIDEIEFVPDRNELRLVPRGVPSVWQL